MTIKQRYEVLRLNYSYVKSNLSVWVQFLLHKISKKSILQVQMDELIIRYQY